MKHKKHVLIIMDGAGDSYRNKEGNSPLGIATTPFVDKIAKLGVCGRMNTLFSALPKESLVAHLGMLGWDPFTYYPSGRASAELLASHNMHLSRNEIAFRANLVVIKDKKLISYNGNGINGDAAVGLARKLNSSSRYLFPEIKLYHNSDFRNTLVVKSTEVEPDDLICVEPHENINRELDIDRFVKSKIQKARSLSDRLNSYLVHVMDVLMGEDANAIIPWSPSGPFHLPAFSDHMNFIGKIGIVGALDFLHGIALAGNIDFFKVGSGMPNTDFEAKGALTTNLLVKGYNLVVCHINAPDEASHMNSLNLKISAIENIDKHIVRPVYEYFSHNLSELGGVMILPDHYTNLQDDANGKPRIASHSLDPVPFALWNNNDQDGVSRMTEDEVLKGLYGALPIPSLSLLSVLTKNIITPSYR